MISHIRLPGTVNVAPLRACLNDNPHLFGEHQERKATYDHQEMVDIWARYNAYENFDPNNRAAFNGEHDSVWYPNSVHLTGLRPVVFQIMQAVQGERLGGVLITKLPPGGKIKRHTDSGWHAGYYSKFYVAVQNPPGALFGFDDGIISAQDGEVWWFDNSKPHWVENATQFDRIAMIVCIKTDLFRQGD